MGKEKKAVKKKKLPKIKPINNFALMAFLTLFEVITAFMSAYAAEDAISFQALAAMGILIVVEWVYLIVFYTAMHRRNFELEMIAFFLCATGISVIASVSPSAALKQCLMIVAGVIVYIVMVFLLGNVDLCMKLRLPVAIAALLLLLVNLIIAETTNGARNWIRIGGESSGIMLQPSEFVKVAFIFVGAATLEKIQTSKIFLLLSAFLLRA